MKPSNIAAYWWLRVSRRLRQEVLAIFGIAIGVALLFSALVANASLVGSFDATMRAVVGEATFQVTARGGTLSDALAREIPTVPGVAAAAPVLDSRVVALGPEGERPLMLLGVTGDFRGLNSRITERLSADYLEQQRAIGLPSPLANDLGLTLGATVQILVNGKRAAAPLGTQLDEEQIGDLVNTPIVLAPLAYAQELLDKPGLITRVFVRAEAGHADDVKRRLEMLGGAQLEVRAADSEAALFRSASAPSSQSTAMFAVFSAMVGFLFAFSAVLLTVPARRDYLSQLLREGYGPRTAAFVMLFDALVLGVIASILGIVIGGHVARHVFGEVPSFLSMAFTFGSRRVVPVESVLLAAAGGVVASCSAVLLPTAGAIRRTHLSGEQPSMLTRLISGVPRWVVPIAGLAFLFVGIVVIAIAPQSAAPAIAGLVCLTAAMLLLLPTLLRAAVAGLDLLTARIRSVVPYIATDDMRYGSTVLRSIAVVATGAVAVFGSVALQGSHGNLQDGLDGTAADLAGAAPAWIVAPGAPNLLATERFDPPRVRRTSGVASVEAYRGSFLDIKDRRVWVFGTPASSPLPVPRGQTAAADEELDRRLRSGRWAVASEAVARENGWKIGEPFTLPSPVPTTFRLAATSTNMGWPPGAIVISADSFAEAWGSSAVSALNVTPATGTTAREAGDAVVNALGSDANLIVKTAPDREAELDAGSRQGLAALTNIAWMVNISAVLAMAAAMAGMLWQRRPELASIKREGYSAREVWLGLLLQTALLTGTGCFAGAAFGLLGQSLLSRALSRVTGFPVADGVAWPIAGLTALTITVAAVLVVGVFGYRVAKVDPGETSTGMNAQPARGTR
ncbi:FtsX-like permease family protein [Conexibacter stalactiti]|uniref:FtsX-like permease family protein n=1 Tax=Conexibacter stalactiti TaxID=1940611 RepID=A0ABU4HJH5_9ACTN|nr:FtsX-like permease family protein [Conexibacter stalactiti]MDW5593470.1 FtsX-like permease family protein [Conexibacter stalactiti]MEC5034111.1 FtsX-like permease family protein [Conexibacter stalactiti]